MQSILLLMGIDIIDKYIIHIKQLIVLSKFLIFKLSL